ncbi:hypothetical protein [Deinococcus hohokamensis]|uniref:Uncharacterized protein n=1 Tax=Deinococcus hohokamensis TaxID=309883 RepID=A0ABV9I4L8_9DEIO
MNVIVAPADRAALWTALPTLPVTWDALPAEGVTLPDGLRFRRIDAPDHTPCLYVTLLESEPFYTQLEDGEGDYTDEERADPDAVIARHYDEADELMHAMVAEASHVLGESSERHKRRGASWLLEDRTLTVADVQWDKEEPIQVCVWLLPPGLTPFSVGLI